MGEGFELATDALTSQLSIDPIFNNDELPNKYYAAINGAEKTNTSGSRAVPAFVSCNYVRI